MTQQAIDRRVGRPLVAMMAALLTLTAVTAVAAPTPVTLTEITKALEVTTGPSEYVVLVDTSVSMNQDGRAQLVRASLRNMFAALDADDRVAMYTFDKAPKLRYRGPAGNNPDELLSRLPRPSGTNTDIGAAISAGVSEFERSDAKDTGAILLFTDGKVDAPADARFNPVGNAAWKALRVRATAVQKEVSIAPLAISLTSSSDAVLLKQVFDDVTTVPATNLGAYLTNVASQVERAAVRASVQADLNSGVELALDTSPEAGGSADATLSITSKTKHLPLLLTGVTLANGAAVTGAPASVDIPAGETVTVPVKVSVPKGASGDLALTATLESSWQKVTTTDLGLAWKPTTAGRMTVGIAPAPTATSTVTVVAQPTPAEPVFKPWMAYAAAAVGLLALVGLVARLIAARRPRLVGSIKVTREGQVVSEQILQGATMHVSAAGLTGTLTPLIEGKRNVTGIRIAFAGTAKASSGVLRDGESLLVGDTTISWTSERTRMMDMIQA